MWSADFDLLPISNRSRRAADRGERFLRGRRGGTCFRCGIRACANGGERLRRRAGCSQPAFESGAAAVGNPGGRHAGQPGARLGRREHAVPTAGFPLAYAGQSAGSRHSARSLPGSCLPGDLVPARGARRSGSKNLSMAQADRMAAIVAPALLLSTACRCHSWWWSNAPPALSPAG